ncbi:DUF2786 domain-containing protein [Nocardia terpenica]|uniref:DUF2786 domain-containing protein n=1 Tax=Nocardia terpenica TaxID=455432 RepID=A0A6G9YZH6_9NOCA|nr:DUF2786 domain-containing protein [Nocardia terpenica]QIS18517.1 hypothetical protein F6W96_09685 [Nocardia terpenica]
MTNEHDYLRKARILFEMAESVAGTPAADTYNERAMALCAKFGIDQAEARRRADAPEQAPIVSEVIRLQGKYIPLQANLLHAIGTALHCATIYSPFGKCVIVYGTTDHILRVRLLFRSLTTQMLIGAANSVPEPPFDHHQVRAYRRSWIIGFIRTIQARLTQVEEAAVANSPGTSLMLRDDGDRAKETMRRENKGSIVSSKTVGARDGRGERHGAQAGARADIGNTAVRGRPALGR